MNVSNEFKQKYNDLLTREKKGAAYIDEPARTPREINKWLPIYMKICEELSEYMMIYKSIEHKEMSIEQVLEGFKEE